MFSLAHWKARSGLPISVNWTFFAGCYSWGATSEYRFKIGNFAPTGAGWPKISGRRGCSSPIILTGLNDLLYGIKIWTDLYSVLSIHAFDRRMDGRTPFSSPVCAGISCNAEKRVQFLAYPVYYGGAVCISAEYTLIITDSQTARKEVSSPAVLEWLWHIRGSENSGWSIEGREYSEKGTIYAKCK